MTLLMSLKLIGNQQYLYTLEVNPSHIGFGAYTATVSNDIGSDLTMKFEIKMTGKFVINLQNILFFYCNKQTLLDRCLLSSKARLPLYTFKYAGPPKAPDHIEIVEETAISVTLMWISELDGGHLQTFNVLLRNVATSSSFTTIKVVRDPGVGTEVKYTVSGLDPKTHYQLKVTAENVKGTVTSNIVNAVTLGGCYILFQILKK